MLDVVPLGGLRVQVAADVVRHLSVLLSLLRAIVLVALVPLIVNAGEYQDVQDQEAAADRDRHAERRRVGREAVLRLDGGILEGQLARYRGGRVLRPFRQRHLRGGHPGGRWYPLDEPWRYLKRRSLN